MSELPTGTVTFLFTDIESSTAHWQQHQEAMRQALARHDVISRTVLQEYRGYIFTTAGDAFCAAFATASDALGAALSIQRMLHAEPVTTPDRLRVRIVLHTGAAEERDGDYFGPPLNRAARLLAAAHGDQILLSLATAELVRDDLPSDVELRDLGTHRLKDLIRSEQLFQLIAPDLPTEFPPLRTLDRHPNNLPVQPTSLVGREREVADISQRLLNPNIHLLTLIGPGGIGKTRLGLQVAAELLNSFSDGVFFVSLVPIRDAALVVSTIAQTVGVRETGDLSLLESLKTYFRDKQLLLILDNFEQVLAAGAVVADLLAAAPHLKALVTSRSVLGVYGEHVFVAPPLTLPDATQPQPLERLAQYEAVRLFIERAQAVQADFEVTNANAPAVAEICHRLDGLPLAIELAAARIRLLPPQALLARLSSRLKVLTGGSRTLPARQQTLRNTIDWSYELLDGSEQNLFRRLAVFVGGRTLEAVEAICNPAGNVPLDLLDGLQSLLDKSLLRQVAGADGEPRYIMLETVWEYAFEQLVASGEAEPLQQRHVEFYLALAEAAEPELTGSSQALWLNRLETEHDNLRAALHRALEQKEGTTALRLSGALWRFWDARGHWSEGRQWLEAALADRGPVSAALRARALIGAGNLACNQSDYIRATTLLEESLALSQEVGDALAISSSLRALGVVARAQGDYRRAAALLEDSLTLRRAIGDKRGIANILENLAVVVKIQGEYERAIALHQESLALRRELSDKRGIASSLSSIGTLLYDQGRAGRAAGLFEESLTLRRELGDKRGIANSLNDLSRVAHAMGDYSRAAALQEESLALFRQLGDKQGMAVMVNNLACVALDLGDTVRAKTLFSENLARFRELGDQFGIALTLNNLGVSAKDQGQYKQALTLFGQALDMFEEQGDKQRIGEVLTGIGGAVGALGQLEHAARLFGAAEALCESIGASLPPSDQVNYERNKASVRTAMGEHVFAAAWSAGRALPFEQILTMAREILPSQDAKMVLHTSAPTPALPNAKRELPAGLTTREVEVLRLVAQGLTDVQVAEKLVVSPRTINGHLTSIYSKLGVTSRTAATRFAIEQKLV